MRMDYRVLRESAISVSSTVGPRDQLRITLVTTRRRCCVHITSAQPHRAGTQGFRVALGYTVRVKLIGLQFACITLAHRSPCASGTLRFRLPVIARCRVYRANVSVNDS